MDFEEDFSILEMKEECLIIFLSFLEDGKKPSVGRVLVGIPVVVVEEVGLGVREALARADVRFLMIMGAWGEVVKLFALVKVWVLGYVPC